MPRPKKPGSAEPKKRSRNGCWPCKNRKIKCGEERPKCQNCERQGETCDYSIRLNWEGRTKRKASNETTFSINASSPPLKRESSASSVNTNNSNNSTVRGPSPNPLGSFMTTQYVNSKSPSPFPSQPSPFRDPLSSAQLSRIREQASPYPSPADTSIESPPLVVKGGQMSYGGHHHSLSNPEMPPPFQSHQYSFSNHGNLRGSPGPAFGDHRAKKMRFSPSLDRPDVYQKPLSLQQNQWASSTNYNSSALISPPVVRYHSSSPSNGSVRLPLTPAVSTLGSEDLHHSISGPSPQAPQESPDFRRLSVKSLLSDDPGTPAESGNSSSSDCAFPGKLNTSGFISSDKIAYGVDRGGQDLDLPRNNDQAALNGRTPDLDKALLDDADGDNEWFSGFGFGFNGTAGFQEGAGYYTKPVTVSISRSLEPLPDMLRENPMNLLYFHHFLNHTARILVPHDCSENPFKSILPQMAVHDTNLLHLLLAYSASHRSRVLNHPEPNNRIALWVQDVFPSLRQALNDPSKQISNSSLATAIMLASLQIINPNTFEISLPWQQHLNIAREMIKARGGAKSVQRADKVSYFLTRWFAYLDVLGSLSGGKNDRPLFGGNYWVSDTSGGEQDYQIDCLLGFTSHLVSILAKIAELAKQCDSERINSAGNIRPEWQPSPHYVSEAQRLKKDLVEARMHQQQGCPHRRASTQIDNSSYNLELITTNEAFHHAGLIHVNRRILGKSSTDPEVQCAVMEIVSALYKVRPGGTAEGCLLFPMFTAGCEAQEVGQKERIMERLKRMEGLGMSHVKKARTLMEKVWETGKPWETLGTGELFFG